MRSFSLHFYEDRNGKVCCRGVTPDGSRFQFDPLDEATSDFYRKIHETLNVVDILNAALRDTDSHISGVLLEIPRSTP